MLGAGGPVLRFRLASKPARLLLHRAVLLFAGFLALGCGHVPDPSPAKPGDVFAIAMIPDTQNYVDYSHQVDEGFALNASDLFIAQMDWIARRARSKGGEIVFVAAVGDVWQHPSELIDAAHADRGIGRVENPLLAGHLDPTPKTRTVEIPKAIEGYERIAAAGLPFGVAPGNHDYDAMWNVDAFPPNLDKPREELTFTAKDIGLLHVGGFDNFRSAFGADTDFFADKPWYVDSFRGGANSAQVFEAGGYRFLHLALEMHAGDAVVVWAQSVIAKHPGLPTIVTTHDYLDARGRRRAASIIDLVRADPEDHNSAEELFEALIAPNDQVFLVLCGHHVGQAFRVDENRAGHAVYQMLADYQARGQAGLDAGQPLDPFLGGPTGIGDGWFRLLRFDLAGAEPRLQVRTYSTHYETHAGDLESYADWYREGEQPGMSAAEFLAAEEFELPLPDFRARFGPPQG